MDKHQCGGCRRFLSWSLAFILSVGLLLPACGAQALNEDYLNSDRWQRNNNVTWEAFDALSGTLGWYVDSERCFYTYFAVDVSLLPNDLSNVKIQFTATTDTETYSFAVDKDGMCDNPSAEEPEQFEVASNFIDADSGWFLAAVQYKGKAETCHYQLRFYSGSRAIAVQGEFAADKPEETTTEKPAKADVIEEITEKETTTKVTTTKAATTKRSNSRSGKSGSDKAQSTTKFVPQAAYVPTGAPSDGTAGEATAEAAAAPHTKMSTDAVLLLLLGAAAVLLGGGILLAVHALRGRQTAAPESEDATESENDS